MTGKFNEDWHVSASADTREGPVDELFSNFLNKSPDSLFRRIDPDYHYPTFGDDSVVEEVAPTLGKFYVKLARDESHAMWGNFKINYADNELAHVDRGLYGGNLHYQSEGTTSFGEQRFSIDGFAAEPGTLASREEFRGTGGSLYFLRNQDILVGSERLRIELRDKDSGLVGGVVNLRPVLDYDIDYLQGRVVLAEALNSTVDDRPARAQWLAQRRCRIPGGSLRIHAGLRRSSIRSRRAARRTCGSTTTSRSGSPRTATRKATPRAASKAPT